MLKPLADAPALSRLHLLEDGESRALLYPEHGFQLHGYDVLVGGETVEVVHGPRGGREPADRRSGNPVLFPSVGVSAGASENHWDHQGHPLLMQQHGWARDLYWHVEQADKKSLTGLLVPTNGMKVAFPFPFELRLRYTLAGRSLILDTTLANTGPTAFPYALGFHPYLRAPLRGGAREQCRVKLPAGVRLQTPDGWRTITRSPAAARTVAASDGELPGSIVLADTGARSLEVEDPAGGLATSITVEDSEQSFPVWVAWSAAPDAPYVCLEPWTDAPNALNRPGTRSIAAGATHRYRMTIAVRAL
jgi:galactose mutarotase-like enzyme